MTDLVPLAGAALSTEHAALLEGVRVRIGRARSSNTRRLYAADWSAFEAWCTSGGLASLPAAGTTVAMYLTRLDKLGRKPSTIDLALATICARHRAAHLANPRDDEVVRETREGIRNGAGVKPRKVAPLVVDELRDVVQALEPDTIAAARDRVLLLVGFAAALRESELVALNVADAQIVGDRMVVSIVRSKTDQAGKGVEIGFSAARDPVLCPLAAVRRWLEVAELREGPLLRAVDRWDHVSPRRLTARSVDLIVKRAVERADLDPALYAGHSLRAGLATSAADAGKSLDTIMRQTRHRSVEVARGYIRRADLFRDNATDGLL